MSITLFQACLLSMDWTGAVWVSKCAYLRWNVKMMTTNMKANSSLRDLTLLDHLCSIIACPSQFNLDSTLVGHGHCDSKRHCELWVPRNVPSFLLCYIREGSIVHPSFNLFYPLERRPSIVIKPFDKPRPFWNHTLLSLFHILRALFVFFTIFISLQWWCCCCGSYRSLHRPWAKQSST